MAVLAGQSEFSSRSLSASDYFVYDAVSISYPDYQELLSTFQSYFGATARQDANYLYLNKADFSLLTSQVSNKAESLLVALLLHVQKYESTSEVRRIDINRLSREFIANNEFNLVKDILLIDLYAKPQYQYGISVIEPNSPLSPSNF